MKPVEIKKDIYWVGALDRDIREFHGYSTPRGTTYNAYLALDEKITLFDTVKKEFAGDLFERIGALTDPAKIDYIVVNHVEMDHTGALPEVVEKVKPEKIICSAMGKKALLAHFHREDWPYEVVGTGQSISLGKRSVSFMETRMLHWPDSMFSYIPEEALLISQDAFGQHWATDERFDDEVNSEELMFEAATYYANILLPYSSLVSKLIENVKAMGLKIDMIAPDHGLIWRRDPSKVIEAWNQWSQQKGSEKVLVVYDTMWHSTETMAKAVADGLISAGMSVQVIDLDNGHRSDVVTHLLDAGAIVFGSATMNNQMLPRVADLLCYLKGLRPQGKLGAAFGSYGWGGEAVKLINAAMEDMSIEVVDPGVRVNYVPTQQDLEACVELGRKVGQALKEKLQL